MVAATRFKPKQITYMPKGIYRSLKCQTSYLIALFLTLFVRDHIMLKHYVSSSEFHTRT